MISSSLTYFANLFGYHYLIPIPNFKIYVHDNEHTGTIRKKHLGICNSSQKNLIISSTLQHPQQAHVFLSRIRRKITTQWMSSPVSLSAENMPSNANDKIRRLGTNTMPWYAIVFCTNILLPFRWDGRSGGMCKDADCLGFTEVQKLKIKTIGRWLCLS